MNKKLTSRIAGGIALASAAALALAACGSSGSGSSAAGGGTTTLKLVVADYGTGPSQHQLQVLGHDRHRLREGPPQHQGQRHHDPLD